METLRDRVNKAKQQDEQSQRDANPYQTAMSPAGVGSSNEHVAKMGGTPNQKQSTNESISEVVTTTPEATSPQQSTVQAAQQQQQPRQDDLMAAQQQPRDYQAEATTERAKGWSEAMQGFGSLGGRVEQLIMDQMSGSQMQGGNAVGSVDFELNDEMVSEFAAPGQEQAVREAFQAFNSAATPEEAFQALAAASGSFANPSAAIVDILGEAYKNDPEAQNRMVADAISQNIIDPDQITIDQLVQGGMLSVDESGMINELGMTEDQVSQMLGENWASLTPAQIEEQLGQFQEENLANREKIMEQLADPSLDPAVRAGLVEELKVMGAVGELEAEQVAEESKQMAADSGKLVIGGEVKDVADLLQDENIQQDVKNYLMGGEMSEEWARENPEFAQWIDREMEDMKGQAQNLENRLDEFAQIQKDNEAFVENNIADQAGGAKLEDDVMKALGFDTEGFQAAGFDPTSNELYTALQDVGDEGTLKGAVEALNELPQMALEELQGEFLTSPEGAQELVAILKDPSRRDDMVKALQLPAKLESMTKPEDMVRAVTGRGLGEVQGAMNKLRLNALIGDPASQKQYNMLKAMFGADGSGQISPDAATVSSAIKAFIDKEGAGGLESLMKGGLGKLGNAFDSTENVNFRGADKHIHERLASFGADGKIDKHELRQLREGFNSNPEVGLDMMNQLRGNPELMKQMGMDANELSKQMKQLSNVKLHKITSGLIGVGQDGNERKLLRPGDKPEQHMANEATRNEWFDAEDRLNEALKSASTPEEKAAINDALAEIGKATERLYLNDWGSELAFSKNFGRSIFLTPEQVAKNFPGFPQDQLYHAFKPTNDGRLILNDATTPASQLFVQYALAKQARLRRKGQDLHSLTRT